jgi:hypothetical protein
MSSNLNGAFIPLASPVTLFSAATMLSKGITKGNLSSTSQFHGVMVQIQVEPLNNLNLGSLHHKIKMWPC